VERVFGLLGAQHLADHTGAYLMAGTGTGPVTFPVAGPVPLPALAIDGKAVRGAIGPDGQIPYLLAAATHGESVVIAERLIGPKTNEVPEFQRCCAAWTWPDGCARWTPGTPSAPTPPSSARNSSPTSS
jgi:hypothetical protein